MAATGKLTKSYLECEYKLAISNFKCAINEDEKWQARKEMAQLEKLAGEMYGFEFMDELHELIQELT